MTIVLGIRHGEVHNPDHLIYARLPGFPLSEQGLGEARALGEAMSSSPIVAVYASPLERAQITASALASPHGLPVLTDERLIEWSFWSTWAGTGWDTWFTDEAATFAVYQRDPGSLHREDPLMAAGERIVAWAGEVAGLYPDGIVLGVSHQAPLSAACLVASGRASTDYHEVHVGHLQAVRLAPVPAEIVDPAIEVNAFRGGGE